MKTTRTTRSECAYILYMKRARAAAAREYNAYDCKRASAKADRGLLCALRIRPIHITEGVLSTDTRVPDLKAACEILFR